MSGLKAQNHQKRKRSDSEDEVQPMETDSEIQEPPKKKCKCVKEPIKSLFSSQISLIRLNAIIPGQEPKMLYQNEHANSIHGHQLCS